MRTFLICAITLAATGCVVQKPALNRPYVAARLDSSKSAAEFSRCSADTMGLEVREQGGNLYIVRTNRNGVQVARWDFLATNDGSQAELRSGTAADAGIDAVRGCA